MYTDYRNYLPLKEIFSEFKDESAIAKEYLKLIVTFSDRFNKKIGNKTNVSLTSDQYSLPFITKRAIFINDETIITIKDNNSIQWTQNHKIFIRDLKSFGSYLKKSKELILNEKLLVLPKVEYQPDSLIPNTSWDSEFEPEYDFQSVEPVNLIANAVFRNNKIVELNQTGIIKNRYVKPIMSIDIPIVDNTRLEDFSKVALNKYNELDNLKTYLKEIIIHIESKSDDEAFYTEMEKINVKIQKDLTNLRSDIKKLAIKNWFKVSGAFLSTTIATLVVVNTELLTDIKTITGYSGGAFLFLDALKNKIESNVDIKNNPLYFLWLLEKKV